MNSQHRSYKPSKDTMAGRSPEKVAVSAIGVPMRKRTEKACDQCRRRKTKCNGSLSCDACLDIGLDCSYGHRVKQARGPQYVAHLEGRVKQLEGEEEQRKALQNPEIPRLQSPSSLSDGTGSAVSDGLIQSTIQYFPDAPSFNSFGRSLTNSDSDSSIQSPSKRQRTASEILDDARVVLEGLAPTNYTAKYTAECLESLSQSLNQSTPPSTPVNPYNSFNTLNSGVPEWSAGVDSFDFNQFVPHPYIDPSQAFAVPNTQNWSSMNFFAGAPA